MSLLASEIAGVSMRVVFTLKEDLRVNPRDVEETQALTLNAAKPTMGLSGRYGLFGSQEWWENIAAERMPLERLSGVIVRVYVAGQDPDDVNTVDIRLPDGGVRSVGIYLNNKTDLSFFRVGHMISIVYVLDELKLQPAGDGGVNVAKIALEMAVSVGPVVV